MDIAAIGAKPGGTYAPVRPSVGGSQSVDGFGKALGEALSQLDGLQRQADAQSAQLASGEPVELHEVMLAQDRASLSMQLAVQVRNKLTEAYQDIMRMQV
jgi:flagellar hook-basal body complex protein FliE